MAANSQHVFYWATTFFTLQIHKVFFIYWAHYCFQPANPPGVFCTSKLVPLFLRWFWDCCFSKKIKDNTVFSGTKIALSRTTFSWLHSHKTFFSGTRLFSDCKNTRHFFTWRTTFSGLDVFCTKKLVPLDFETAVCNNGFGNGKICSTYPTQHLATTFFQWVLKLWLALCLIF